MKLSHQRPQLRRPSKLTLSVIVIGTLFIATTSSAPAKATRPTVRTAVAIKNLKLSMPIPIERASKPTFLGLDLEEKDSQKLLLKQASNYWDLRRGRQSEEVVNKWLAYCFSKIGTIEEDPFCKYESDRRNSTKVRTSRERATDERHTIATQLKEGRFDKISSRSHQEIIFAVSVLERNGDLPALAKKVMETNGCISPSVPAAAAYKLEEKFPEQETVATAKKLYAKAAKCGENYSAAFSNYRLALINIWQGKCEDVHELMSKVQASREASFFHSRAAYWRYHCASILKDDEKAKQARAELLRDHALSFHNLAANGTDEVAMSQVIRSVDPQISVRSLVRPDLNLLIRGSEAMMRIGQNHIATEIIDRNISSFESLEPEVRLYLALLLNRMEQALPKFKLLASLFQDVPSMVSSATMKLFYPLWYYDQVKAKQDNVDPLLILSLIRQESAFNRQARSIVGARGLMQVMPATARMVASVRTPQLYDVSTNLRVGSQYFLKRLHQYDGDVELTLAAYNAGAARVDEWRKRYPTDNKMLFMDFIPFRETREYVAVILRNYYWYVKLYSKDIAATSPENAKITAPETKVTAILSANAGAAASLK